MNRSALRTVVGLTIIIAAAAHLAFCATDRPNLVANGAFERNADGNGRPDDWTAAGNKEVKQQLTLDVGRDGGRSAKLTCTEFVARSPSSHVMICQVGKIAVKAGRYYRLTWWAKGDAPYLPVKVSLVNTRQWRDVGLSKGFVVPRKWRRFEQLFQASQDLASKDGRFQFWFGSTGTLWLDDVVLVETDIRVQHHPLICTEGVRNVIPNSSFECGPAGWGSYAPKLGGWTGNVYRLLGEIDESTAVHGKRSLRIRLAKDRPPIFYFDYYGPIAEPIQSALAAHIGWVPTLPGKPYTLSCALKADRPNVAARFLVREGAGKTWDKIVRIGVEWQRKAFTFRPDDGYVWSAIGLDLEASQAPAATLWVDAVQLEQASKASAYALRTPVESFIETPALGNIFANPEAGMTVRLVAQNSGKTAHPLRGTLKITDFCNRTVFERDVGRSIAPETTDAAVYAGLLKGKRGFFRARWQTSESRQAWSQTLRCAVIDPYAHDDSPFGMNHAYPWAFLLRLGKLAGLTWHRDWSVKWQTVQPKPGDFDFAKPDAQIDRVLREGLNVLALFPAPSALWSSAGDLAKIDRMTATARHRRNRYVESCPPKDLATFRTYIAQSVRHYRDRVRHYEILNEPLYTGYAVPLRLGYRLPDYLELLDAAHSAIRAEQPDATIIGGVPCWTNTRLVSNFIDSKGMEQVDVLNLHHYPSTIAPAVYEEALAGYRKQMRRRGCDKPIWLTEFGCYADDDPPTTPYRPGDTAMTRAHWDSERLASEALVKWTAVGLHHGIAKIFFHAGVCGAINGRDAGSVFFEYGGAPRKMYAAMAALANLLGPDAKPVPLPGPSRDPRIYAFANDRGMVAVVWSIENAQTQMRHTGRVRAFDIMGNEIETAPVTIDATPVYMVYPDADVKWLGALRSAAK